MTTSVIVRWCGACHAEEAFESPDCLDGHGPDCPELVCVECGEAVLVGFAPVPESTRFRPVTHVA